MATHAARSLVCVAPRWSNNTRVGARGRTATTAASRRTHGRTPTRHPGRNAAAKDDPRWGLDLDDDDGVEGVEPPQGQFVPTIPPNDTHLKSPKQWSPVSYAFLGDAVWELYVRRAFFAPPCKPVEYDLKTKRAARAEAQDMVLRELMDESNETPFFTDEELAVVRWGRNGGSAGNTPSRLRGKKKGGFATYRNASALECVVGYLYITDGTRLQVMMDRVIGSGLLERTTLEKWK